MTESEFSIPRLETHNMVYDAGLGAEVVQHFGTSGNCAVVVMSKPGQESEQK